jgi:diguanylate cyclase (GGDEF)-like protein
MVRSLTSLKHNYIDLHARAVATGTLGGPLYPTLYKNFFQPPSGLHDRIQAFVKAADLYVVLEDDKQEQRTEALEYIEAEAGGHLVTILDNVLRDYQSRGLENAQRYSAWQFWNVVIILTVLLLEALFIFRPLVRATRQYQETLRRQAFEDSLTGLNNRRAFIKRSKALLRHLSRERRPAALVLTDLDHFKSINDTYGHKAGDLVLKHFSNILQKSMRPSDVTGRIGGEEFAIILANTGQDTAEKIIERLRRQVESSPCTYEENGSFNNISYTASFGIIIAKDIWEVEDLLDMADKNLYKAKHAGRNTISISIAPAAPEENFQPRQ